MGVPGSEAGDMKRTRELTAIHYRRVVKRTEPLAEEGKNSSIRSDSAATQTSNKRKQEELNRAEFALTSTLTQRR